MTTQVAPPPGEQLLDPEKQATARKYARIMRWLFFIDLALGVAFLMTLALSGLSIKLRSLLDFPQPATVALYFATLAVCYGAILAPLSFYSGFVLPRRYGLSKQAFGSWLLDILKGGLMGLMLGMGIMVVVYWFLSSFPNLWWLLAAAVVALLSVLLTSLAPLIILPLFFKLKPLDNPSLTQRLAQLAERARRKVCGVFTIDLSSKSTGANAALMGLGNTRRIVLGDTLLDGYSDDEVEVILAHELGHLVHHDIAKLILLQSGIVLGGFYSASLALNWAVPRLGFSGIEDVAAFPLLALAFGAFALAARPLSGVFSRRLERAADEYALKLTDNPGAFIAMMTKLTDQNLSEAEPSRWVELLFYDHPPYSKRVRLARQYAVNS